MFEWLTEELMEVEMAEKIGADKYEQNQGHKASEPVNALSRVAGLQGWEVCR